MNARFEPPTVAERGNRARAVAEAMHLAGKAMEAGQNYGRLSCTCCGGVINWRGSNGRSAGSCVTPQCARWSMP